MKDIEGYIESFVCTDTQMKMWNPKHKQLVIDVLTDVYIVIHSGWNL